MTNFLDDHPGLLWMAAVSTILIGLGIIAGTLLAR